MASVQLDVLKDYKVESRNQCDNQINERHLVRNLFCVVLCYYMHSVKGGWQHLEETVNFLVAHFEQVCWNLHHAFNIMFSLVCNSYYDFILQTNDGFGFMFFLHREVPLINTCFVIYMMI